MRWPSAVSNARRAAAAAIVEREHDVAVLRQVLVEQVAPRVLHALHAGSAIHVDEHRVALAGAERCAA